MCSEAFEEKEEGGSHHLNCKGGKESAAPNHKKEEYLR